MKSSHRFPLRRQIVWGMRFFTFLTSLAVGAALFILSNQYVRANSLQAAEFNLRLVATSIETSLESADALLNWASIDSTVRRYITQENINGTQTIAAYEAVQEKYYSSTLYSHILRFFVTNENDRHLQFGTLNSSAALNRTSINQFLTKGYGMQFTTDPLLPGSPDCIALSQPVRCGKGTLHRGSTYLALDTAIITDPAAGYSLTDGRVVDFDGKPDELFPKPYCFISSLSFTIKSSASNCTITPSGLISDILLPLSFYFIAIYYYINSVLPRHKKKMHQLLH